MSIRRIPQQVSNCLTSSSSVFSVVSVVKELIDNALDASATQIHIEVDLDTGGLQYVSVKDNGDGVSPKDRPLMCANCTTSKIRGVEDIQTALSLGFRGEALFFLAQVASKGTMEITSRTKEESMGEKWFVGETGIPIGSRSKPVATPVGTIVTLTGLFKATPVRRNLLKKEAKATIEKLKAYMTSYSVTFRDVRLTLKIVKVSTTGKLTSVPDDGLVLAPKIPVKALVSSLYKLKSSSQKFFEGEIAISLNDSDRITVRYVLPRMRAEDDVTLKKPFKSVSINNRPLLPNLSLGKALRKILNKIYSRNMLLTPTVWVLDIHCPKHLVDVNIEPEKTDVLLSNFDEILHRFEIQIEESVQSHHYIVSGENQAEVFDVSESQPEPDLQLETHIETDDVPNNFSEIESRPEKTPEAIESDSLLNIANDKTSPLLQPQPTTSGDQYFLVQEADDDVIEQFAEPISVENTSTFSPDTNSQQVSISEPITRTPLQRTTMKLVLNGDSNRQPERRATNIRLLKHFTENTHRVDTTMNIINKFNDNHASQTEVEWLVRKGEPSVNVLEGYQRLRRLTSGDGLNNTDSIVVLKTKAWMKLS
ncbi:unnamed protein product [Kuraishia capsulata CBS 1993]|uniref:DNA mismatch repair protein S5 domain-containing protein n=1 Tax=Kuraishia capsulata CBS 1993 TaxID=1382522 RepID=W6MVT5_9ASCO|nr:uncharacterized protein KUCA_T00002477001 [Kuraishia capsulata CBS 1993]CDK26505.1 unnamed protein product [Kuraishia capsulata CBS 1993]